MRELDPVGGARRQRPLDPPMQYYPNTLHRVTRTIKLSSGKILWWYLFRDPSDQTVLVSIFYHKTNRLLLTVRSILVQRTTQIIHNKGDQGGPQDTDRSTV